MNRRTPSAEARAGGVRVSGSPPTRFQPPGLGRVLNSLLTQIRAASATALGRGSVGGQGPEPDPAGRGLGHGEEMNEQKCLRGLTAPRPSVRAAWMPAALPSVCRVGQGQRTATTRGADQPKSVQVLILLKGSLPQPQSHDPQQPSLGLGRGPLGHRAQAHVRSGWLMFNRLLNVNQPEILIQDEMRSNFQTLHQLKPTVKINWVGTRTLLTHACTHTRQQMPPR